jgi:hypothetical protein
VNCGAVRDRLAEHALGVAGGRDDETVDRHVAWCAACRKEARDLRGAAASLAYALAPVEPVPALEERVVAAVQDAAGRRRSPHRRSRLATVAALTAVLAVVGLGWGAVMAGRVARLSDQADLAASQARIGLEAFGDLVEQGAFAHPGTEAFLGTLRPSPGLSGGGAVLTVVSPGSDDQAVVMLTGLRSARRTLPYRVTLWDPRRAIVLGRIAQVNDADGSARILRILEEDLRGFDRVVVRDAQGRVVLRGDLEAEMSVPSPSP